MRTAPLLLLWVALPGVLAAALPRGSQTRMAVAAPNAGPLEGSVTRRGEGPIKPPAPPSDPGRPARHAPPGYERLFDTLWATVNAQFYDPSFRGVDWRAVGERYRPRVAGVGTPEEFLRLGTEMLMELRSSHLHLAPPAAPATDRVGVGARFARIGPDLVVSELAPLSDARRQGLRPGDRLLSPPASLRGAAGSTATLDVEGCDGTRRTVSVRREGAFWPPEHPGLRWSVLNAGPEARIGYLKADRFDDGAAELIDQAMRELGSTTGLVIDVRDNSGGNASALRLNSYFADAQPGVVLISRAYLKRLGAPVSERVTRAVPRVQGAYTTRAIFAAVAGNGGAAAFWTEDVGERRYRAPVVVLIGENTGSAAEGFAWFMRARTHARLLGRQSAGALLSGESFDLGDGWSVTVPVHGLWSPEGEDYGDRAVPPHVVVERSREALCAGRDPEVEAALDLLTDPAP